MGIPQRASTIIRLPPSASVPASWPSRSDSRTEASLSIQPGATRTPLGETSLDRLLL